MSVTRVRFVDPLDVTDVRLELNLPDGPIHIQKGYDAGTADLESIFIGEQPFNGADLATSRRDLLVKILPIYIDQQASYAALKAIHDALAVELDRETNCIEFLAEDSSESEYLDTFRSPIPPLFSGRDLPDGELHTQRIPLDLDVVCNPNPRLASVTEDDVEVSNALNDRHFVVANPGNVDSELILRLTPTAGKVAAIRGGIRTGEEQIEFRTGYMAPLANASLKTDTAPITIAGAMGTGAQAGKAALVTFATQETMARRLRNIWTPVSPKAIEGLHRLLLRVQHDEVTANDRGRFAIKPYYGFSTTEIAMEELPRRVFDFRDLSTDDWTEVDLGLIKVDEGAGRLVLDIWAERLDGDGQLYLDARTYEPAGVHNFIVGVPNFRQGHWGREIFEADELDGTGKLFRETYRLNETDEYGRTFPAAGFLQIAGTHTVTFDVSVREPDDPEIDDGPNPTEKVIGEVQVWRDTGAGFGANPWKKMKLRNRKNRLWTRSQRKIVYSVSAPDEAGSYRYRYQVEFTADALDGRRIQIHDITHGLTPALTVDTDLFLDAFTGREYIDAVGVTDFEAILESGRIMVPPDESTIVLTSIDLPTDVGYDDIDEQEVVGISSGTRTLTVQDAIIPRKAR